MSEFEPIQEIEDEKKVKESPLGSFIAFIKKHIMTIIVCIIAFLAGYYLSTFKKTLPIILDDDFTSGDMLESNN